MRPVTTVRMSRAATVRRSAADDAAVRRSAADDGAVRRSAAGDAAVRWSVRGDATAMLLSGTQRALAGLVRGDGVGDGVEVGRGELGGGRGEPAVHLLRAARPDDRARDAAEGEGPGDRGGGLAD